MVTLSSYYEGVDSVSPGSMSVSPRDGSSTRTYYVLNVTQGSDLTDAFAMVLGDVNVNKTGNQRLNRTCPVCDPQMQIWTAKGISGIQGLGTFTRTAVTTFVTGGADPIGDYALYKNYKIEVSFGQQPYAVLQDFMIDVPTPPPQGSSPGFWFDIDPFTGSESQKPWLYAAEWQRYTEYDLVPQNDYVTAVKGGAKFISNITPPGGKKFNGMPKMFVPNQILRIMWREVPLRYYQSPKSFLKQFKGRVNQFDWFETEGGYLFPKGSLLYLNCTPKIYTGPLVALQAWGNGELTPPKVCDYELTFLTTDRICGGTQPAYTNGADNSDVPRRNFIPAGLNLQPWFPLSQFFYVVSGPAKGQTPQNIPFFLSFPVELLFTDPDAPQPGTWH